MPVNTVNVNVPELFSEFAETGVTAVTYAADAEADLETSWTEAAAETTVQRMAETNAAMPGTALHAEIEETFIKNMTSVEKLKSLIDHIKIEINETNAAY